jgi:hypothetical protein
VGRSTCPAREIFAIPHLPGLLFWALAGRLPLVCITLAITFLIAAWTGSYTLARAIGGCAHRLPGRSGALARPCGRPRPRRAAAGDDAQEV